jgi:3-deoxy-7-phosphoheptulonate synthase
MIVHLNKSIDKVEAEALGKKYEAICFHNDGQYILVTSSKLKEADAALKAKAEATFVTDTDIQLASKQYIPDIRAIDLGVAKVGGHSVELGVKVLRAGAYKPRTSPYTFQGLGLEGLKLLDKMRSKYGLKIITEVRDSTHVEEVIEYADIIQVGAKAMYDQGILRKCGKSNKSVLIKRGFGSTLQEFVQSAEFVLSSGNANVMLCERGIRTFETKTRFTLDLCGVAWLKQYTNLPVILDPSHAIGYAYGVADLSRACVAMGVDGLLIETHPNPKVAKSDAEQQLNFEQFRALHKSLEVVANAVGRNIT